MTGGYTIVKFHNYGDGESILAVPISWVVEINGKKHCYFPKENLKQCIKRQTPVRGNWDLYEITPLSRKIIATYGLARLKERKACYTSGVDSTDNDSPTGKVDFITGLVKSSHRAQRKQAQSPYIRILYKNLNFTSVSGSGDVVVPIKTCILIMPESVQSPLKTINCISRHHVFWQTIPYTYNSVAKEIFT